MNITEESKTINTSETVKGYNPQSQDNIDLVNKFKALEAECAKLWREAQQSNAVDARCFATGKTKLQEAFMWINRGIFKPTDFFE